MMHLVPFGVLNFCSTAKHGSKVAQLQICGFSVCIHVSTHFLIGLEHISITI